MTKILLSGKILFYSDSVGGPNEGGGACAGGTYFPRFSTNEVPARQEKTSEAAGSCGEESCS